MAPLKPVTGEPKELAEATKLAATAIQVDRAAGNLKEAKKKLDTAILKCRACSPSERGELQLLLGVVLADLGDDKEAVKRFQAAFKIDPDTTLGGHGGPLRSRAAERVYAEARQKSKLPPMPPPEPPVAPDKAVLAAAEAPVVPLATLGGAAFTPGLGLVTGVIPEKPPEGVTSTLSKPRVTAASTSRGTFTLAVGYVQLKPIRDNQEGVGSLAATTGPRLDFGGGFVWSFDGAKFLHPGLGLMVGLSRPSDGTKYFLAPGGDQQFWMVNSRVHAGIGLSAGPLTIRPHAGVFHDYYSPADTVPGNKPIAAALYGFLYGGSVGISGESVGASLGYTFEKGPEQTARKRRIELFVGGTRVFWEARERTTGGFSDKATYGETLAASMPVKHHYGFSWQW